MPNAWISLPCWCSHGWLLSGERPLQASSHSLPSSRPLSSCQLRWYDGVQQGMMHSYPSAGLLWALARGTRSTTTAKDSHDVVIFPIACLGTTPPPLGTSRVCGESLRRHMALPWPPCAIVQPWSSARVQVRAVAIAPVDASKSHTDSHHGLPTLLDHAISSPQKDALPLRGVPCVCPASQCIQTAALGPLTRL